MKKVMVNLEASLKRSYPIWVGSGTLGKISELFDLSGYSKIFVVSDQALQPLLDKLMATLPDTAVSIAIPADEQRKHIETIQQLWTAMHDAGCDRKSLVINLGGGVIGDVGGFAASTYMRGVDFLNVPTTLLAQVDASAGGKTGFNFAGVKNLIGAIRQPIGVVADTGILATLPKREFLSGFAEIIKHGLIRDAEYFEQVTAKPPLEFSQAELEDIIAKSCQIKATIVQSDETEEGERRLVNFGHTVGHAIEVLSHNTDKPLLHGEAISIGMRAEAIISQQLGMLSEAELGRLEQALINAELPLTIQDMNDDDIKNKMQSDKKNEAGNINLTLLNGVGAAVYNQKVDDAVINKALELTRQAP